jgi:hypothetical protein
MRSNAKAATEPVILIEFRRNLLAPDFPPFRHQCELKSRKGTKKFSDAFELAHSESERALMDLFSFEAVRLLQS